LKYFEKTFRVSGATVDHKSGCHILKNVYTLLNRVTIPDSIKSRVASKVAGIMELKLNLTFC
jgi:hypothetical protein